MDKYADLSESLLCAHQGRMSKQWVLISVHLWRVISETFPDNIVKNSNKNTATKIHLSHLNASSDKLFNKL